MLKCLQQSAGTNAVEAVSIVIDISVNVGDVIAVAVVAVWVAFIVVRDVAEFGVAVTAVFAFIGCCC